MNDTLKSFSPWVPVLNPTGVKELWDYINLENECSPMKYYVSLMGKFLVRYNLPDEKTSPPDMLASGMVFFYGCMMFLMHNENWHHHIDALVQYSLLYMMVDNYIDSTSFSPIVLHQMQQILNREEMTTDDPLLVSIREVYYKLTDSYPESTHFLKKLFFSEIAGLKIQKNSSLSEEEYFKIACEKGGNTFLVLYSFLHPEFGTKEHNKDFYSIILAKKNGDDVLSIGESAYFLGALMQLIDDSLDVEQDRDNGVFTVATFHYEKNGSIDQLWKSITDLVLKIDSPFMSFKLAYSLLMVYIPGRVPNFYSQDLLSWTALRNPFPNADCSQFIVSSIRYWEKMYIAESHPKIFL